MAKVDKEFNVKDWEWIAVHFPASERESMAKVAWIICCKCTPEKISQHKIDPRIVIPLCAIELLDEKDISNFQKFAKEKKVDTYHRILAESKIKQGNSNRVKQEFISLIVVTVIFSIAVQDWNSFMFVSKRIRDFRSILSNIFKIETATTKMSARS